MGSEEKAQKEKVPEVFLISTPRNSHDVFKGLTGEGIHTAGISMPEETGDCPYHPDELPFVGLLVPPPLCEGQEAIRYLYNPAGNIYAVEYLVSIRRPKWGILDWVCFDYETELEYLMRVNAERFCEQVMHQLATTSPWLNIIQGGTFPDLTER